MKHLQETTVSHMRLLAAATEKVPDLREDFPLLVPVTVKTTRKVNNSATEIYTGSQMLKCF